MMIGPLARLDRRLLPILYNRRHLGVATFLVGLAHAVLSVGYYHGHGRQNALVSLLTANDAVRHAKLGTRLLTDEAMNQRKSLGN